ncbi:acid protease [Auricularia subglabra TFB-10046 SS5]|uniref:Acid protease n=1 Tax=Auricularia subglabra (strain TFB-10046 / SS5) TaxID=717982 RepID=J0D924_AURST|nr:acid protease [Auricularia subglabra TFB-10046 SS5]
MITPSYLELSQADRASPPAGIKIMLGGEEGAAALLADLSATPCKIPNDWISSVGSLECYSDESNLTVATLLRLCSRLPQLRVLDLCNLQAPLDDFPGLINSIMRSNAFENVTHCVLGSYAPGATPLTAAYAIISSMRKVQRVELDMFAFPWQEAERERIQNLGLAHVRLRSYTCAAFFFRCALPIVDSADTLEHLEIILDDKWHTNIANKFASALRTRSFVRLRALDVFNEANAFQYRGTMTEAIQSIFKECPNLPLLPAVFIAVSFLHTAAGARLSARELSTTPGIRFTTLARRAPDDKLPTSPKGIRAGNFENTAYVGNLTLGSKSFLVQLDTGSSDLWVDHGSQTIEQLGGDSIPGAPRVKMSYALGSVDGTPVYGDVSLGDYHSQKQLMLSADGAANLEALKKYGISGILGLGLDGGALIPTILTGEDAEAHSFLGNIFAQNASAGSFTTWYLGRDGDGLMTINELPESYAEPIKAAPEIIVHSPLAGDIPRWAIEVASIEVGGKKTDLISELTGGTTRAIAVVDTGATLSFIPKEITDLIYSGVPGAKYASTVGVWVVPCTASIDVAFTIGRTRYFVDPLDVLSRPAEIKIGGKAASVCIGGFIPAPAALQQQLELDLLLGDNFLRNVFSVLHYNTPSMQLLSVTDETEAKAQFAGLRDETMKAFPPEVDLTDEKTFNDVVSALGANPLGDDPGSSSGDGNSVSDAATHLTSWNAPVLIVLFSVVMFLL